MVALGTVSINSVEEEKLKQGLLSCGIKDSFDTNNRKTAIVALEQLSTVRKEAEDTPGGDVHVLRCLLMLKSLSLNPGQKELNDKAEESNLLLEEILQLIKVAKQKFVQWIKSNMEEGINQRQKNKHLWFVRFSWNMAIKASEVGFGQLASNLYELTLGFDDLLQQDDNAPRRKLCYLMVAASKLSRIVTSMTNHELTEVADSVINSVKSARRIIKENILQKDEQFERLLVEIEFRALIYSKKESQLYIVLNETKQLLNPERWSQLYVILGNIASEAKFYLAGIKAYQFALMGALDCAKTCSDAKIESIMQPLRLIIQLAVSCDEERTCLDTAERLLNHLSRVIEFPSDEISWIIVELWNYGVDKYQCKSGELAR